MDNVTLNNITASCKKELSALFIGTGLDQLRIIARYCSDSQIISQVEELEENYHCMLMFLAGGGKDEERAFTQKKICKKAQEILRVAHRNIRLQEEHTKYSKAFHELKSLYGVEPEEELLRKWGTNPMPDEQLLIQDHIFNLIWTSPLWNQKHTAQWYEFISRQTEFAKIGLLPLCTPILAYAGISAGKDLDTFKKQGFAIVCTALIAFIGTYIGSAIIAQIVLRLSGVI